MIEIEALELQNFLSYGNYRTRINIAGLGPCLIRGEVDGMPKRQNATGKSTIPNAILWGLFGRTMHSPKPGDRIINWFSGKDCVVSLPLKDGTKIIRTRRTDQTNELIVERNGENCLKTLSTTPNQQTELEMMYGVNWNTYVGSSSFNQYGRPWFDMVPEQRKLTIEKTLGIHLVDAYASAAKAKLDAATRERDLAAGAEQARLEEINKAQRDIEHIKQSQAGFETERQARITNIENRIKAIKIEINKIEEPDIETIKEEWAEYRKLEADHRSLSLEIDRLRSDIESRKRKITDNLTKIEAWKKKSGKMCLECEQDIKDKHVRNKIEPIESKVEEDTETLNPLLKSRKDLVAKLELITSEIKNSTPKMSVREATLTITHRSELASRLASLRDDLKQLKEQENPHFATAERLIKWLKEASEAAEAATVSYKQFEAIRQHLHYIYKAYADRSRIKHHLINRHLNSFNSYLRHYLDRFGLDIGVELTESLNIKTDMWGYEFMSGGEKKRAEVSFMLAMFNLHEDLYGRQSNVITLDEVDGALDGAGVEALLSVITEELAEKVDAVLVISNKHAMKGALPREILVKRLERQSMVAEIS